MSRGADRECSCTHSIAAMLIAMSCRTQDVSVVVHLQLLLCSLLCHVARSRRVLLHIFNCCYAHCYVVPRADGECSCMHAIVTVLTAMSCRTQIVSVFVAIQS